MSDIDGDDLVRRLATRIAELEIANAMLSQQAEALRAQLAAATSEARDDH